MPQSSEKPRHVTVKTLAAMKQSGEKIACLTAYDAGFAALIDAAGVEVVLVGDSLGMVLQGHDSTLPVTVSEMVYHGAMVARGSSHALRVVDMPFMSYTSPAQAIDNAARLMREGAAQMVKLEGGAVQLETVRHLTAHGIPVCAHLGLIPQSVHQLGGYQVQGRDATDAQRLLEDARALEQAGAGLLVLECIPAALARSITEASNIPTIGIGAGADCDGQVLVLYDMLGITVGNRPRFVKDFLAGNGDIRAAVVEYVRAVKAGEFPGPAHTY